MKLHTDTECWKPILYGIIDGEVDLDSSVRLLKFTTTMAAQKHISKILIDARLATGSLSADERVTLGAKLADHVKKLTTKESVAFVGYPPPFNRLGIDLARGRGVDVELFQSIPDALAWLGEDTSMPHWRLH